MMLLVAKSAQASITYKLPSPCGCSANNLQDYAAYIRVQLQAMCPTALFAAIVVTELVE